MKYSIKRKPDWLPFLLIEKLIYVWVLYLFINMKQASKVLSIKSKTTSVSKGKGASGSSQKKGSSSQSGCANAVMLIKSNEKNKTPIKLLLFEPINIKIAIVGK